MGSLDQAVTRRTFLKAAGVVGASSAISSVFAESSSTWDDVVLIHGNSQYTLDSIVETWKKILDSKPKQQSNEPADYYAARYAAWRQPKDDMKKRKYLAVFPVWGPFESRRGNITHPASILDIQFYSLHQLFMKIHELPQTESLSIKRGWVRHQRDYSFDYDFDVIVDRHTADYLLSPTGLEGKMILQFSPSMDGLSMDIFAVKLTRGKQFVKWSKQGYDVDKPLPEIKIREFSPSFGGLYFPKVPEGQEYQLFVNDQLIGTLEKDTRVNLGPDLKYKIKIMHNRLQLTTEMDVRRATFTRVNTAQMVTDIIKNTTRESYWDGYSN